MLQWMAMAQPSDDGMVYRCVAVVGDGELCGESCEPGFVRCRRHRTGEDRAALKERVALAREYVLLHVEQHIEALCNRLIQLALTSDDEKVSLAAIDRAFSLLGADKVTIELGQETLDHIQGRDARLVALLKSVPGPLSAKAQQLQERLAIEATAREAS